MRIAIVCPYYPFPPSIGGVETIVRNVSTELARRGYDVHIVTTPHDVTTGRQVSEYGVEERDGITIYKLRPTGPRVGYARLLKGLKKTIREVQPDIVHSHNLHPHLFQLAMWKDQLRYRLIAELHHPVASLERLSAKLAYPLASVLLRKFIKNIDFFIAHTNMEKEWLIKQGMPSENVEIIRFPSIPSRLLNYELHRECPTEDYILFVGRITWIKGIDTLFKAFKIIKENHSDIKLKLAGPPDHKYKKYLENILEKLQLESSVDFTGPVYDDEKIRLIKCSKLLVLPSFKEYTPSTLLEAQALGVPVVATRVGAVPEIVKDGETGILVQPNDTKALANAIEMLLTHNDLWEAMSINTRRWARRFTLEEAVNNLDNIYKNFFKR